MLLIRGGPESKPFGSTMTFSPIAWPESCRLCTGVCVHEGTLLDAWLVASSLELDLAMLEEAPERFREKRFEI
jgi:hypothetical protein